MTAPVAAEGRKLGPVLATVIVAGNMIGSGIYLLPASLGAIGSISLVGWVIAAAGALVLAGAFAALARLRPQDDGLVAYVRAGLGPFAGFQAGWLFWVGCLIGNVAIALAVTGYAAYFVPALKTPAGSAAATMAVIWLITLAALLGPRAVGRMGAATLALGLAPILLVAVGGWIWFEPAIFEASWNVSGRSAPAAVQTAVVSVFWAFLGLESASACAAVVRNPRRNIPIAVIGGVTLAAAVYIAAVAAIMGIVPAVELEASTAPFALVVQRVLGGAAGALIAACALLKASGTLAGWMLVAGQIMRAAADQGLFPAWLATSRADGTPVRSLLVLAGLMSGVAILSVQPTLGAQFGVLANASVVLTLAIYILCVAAIWRFSRKAGLLALAAAAIAFSVAAALMSGWTMLAMTAGVAALGAAIWRLSPRRPTGGAATPPRAPDGSAPRS
ncbi:amino acid permease [Phenylobacterium sp.]|jgi:arginine:agmatine antiporter|uniref:amino acid permease n=1 Tax=Phenylobacterium sp. TaxID=1871053 RepID=UPI002F93B82F